MRSQRKGSARVWNDLHYVWVDANAGTPAERRAWGPSLSDRCEHPAGHRSGQRDCRVRTAIRTAIESI